MTRLGNDLTQRFVGAVGVAAIASLVALPGFAQTTRPGEAPVPTTDRTAQTQPTSAVAMLDQEFLKLAYQGNNAEIDTSRLALERSQNEEIRQYAQRMIAEHTRANEVLTQYAAQEGLELPSARVDPLSLAIAEQLTQLSGPEFDQAYVGVQANSHLRAIALYRTEIAQGQTQELTEYASQLLPSIEEHYEMASAMMADYAADSSRPPVNVQPIQ
ncbi:DUF4142 domain-containing protein [Nodosilinea sp. LEGE 06152]|uniref:DUF4142 domain-containing protein n=1 Tax=Nodosilinea sp. LEGE 06152 TaxID=2777966 RepID=UPI001880C195|nr:DUF4142 domain-containing protein [Nodosilinea sp. LEGE 06152]MBE9159919.1 DUF4142 domain-containing protein [Nodosilinea sp. LEGE 06152]